MYDLKNVENKNRCRNLFLELPNNIISLIFQYDGTYHKIYKQLIQDIKLFPIWNITTVNKENSLDNQLVYYCKNIASDMMCHWNNHYTSFIDSLLNYSNHQINEDRILVNYLDNNNCGSIIPGRKETLFEWIQYYNKVISR
jgi:hypothetical protein